jgi:hypothetical protein
MCRLYRRVPPPRSGLLGFASSREVIMVPVYWYLRHGQSDRNVEELLAKRRDGPRQHLQLGAVVHAAAY